MEIYRDRACSKVILSQKQHLTKLVSNPLASHLKFSVKLSPLTDEKQEYMLQVSYSNTVGRLMYLLVCVNPDISQVASMVSKYMHNFGKGHL